ncbi:hypothetical protein G166_gp81 [Clostridium phage phi8074-B1]|uniref:hypothetical protein n=1 Tax=Clostridium phage phi8074-B1 TaxID=1147137 RepID=UPI00025C0C84|nr:hypothetical protein G166_gp81 [Clostridium phage phi8074-B1]AFC62013.1 hypothetical protein phi8074-B1_00081 [Clostridium phage phi8074-B1]
MLRFVLFVTSCAIGSVPELNRNIIDFDTGKDVYKPMKVWHIPCYILWFCYLPFIFIPRTKMFRTLISWLNSEVGGKDKK